MRFLIKKLKERRKSINIWINSETRVEIAIAQLLLLALIAKIKNRYSRSYASTVIK